MKTWTYTRALRWLAIEPETRRIDIYLAPGDLYKTNMRLKDISFHQLRDQYELGYFYRPPTDPVPLAEVLYELVSGEEEEFEMRGHEEYTKIKWSGGYFVAFSGDDSLTYFGQLVFTKRTTFHRIAEPEEKREPAPDIWCCVEQRQNKVACFFWVEEVAVGHAKHLNRMAQENNKEHDFRYRVAKFREVVE